MSRKGFASIDMRWQQAQPQGRLRKPCEGHTVSVVDKRLYVLFGKHEDDHGNPICPPMQVLDTDTMTLSTPHFEHGIDGRPNTPNDREGHTASAVGSRIFVFGGTWTDEDDNTLYMNDMHILDTTSLRWTCPAPIGTPPIEREGHTAAVVGAQMVVFGGAGLDAADHSINLNDLHLLTTETMTWSQPLCS